MAKKKHMDKQLRKRVMERSEGLCELCKGNQMVQPHHIIGGNGKRLIHETDESVIALCWEHHHGTYGVHGKNGKPLRDKLKIMLRDKYLEQGYSLDEVRTMMGGELPK